MYQYLDVATAAVAFERSVWIGIELEFWLPINRVKGNDTDLGHKLFEFFEGDILRKTTHIHVAVLLLFNFKPR